MNEDIEDFFFLILSQRPPQKLLRFHYHLVKFLPQVKRKSLPPLSYRQTSWELVNKKAFMSRLQHMQKKKGVLEKQKKKQLYAFFYTAFLLVVTLPVFFFFFL